MKRSEIEERTEALVEPILAEQGLTLWDVEYVKEGPDYYLRVYIDKEEGVNIDDCVAVSRSLDPKLDEGDFIKDQYILEVSSPGLGRTLKRDRDFEKSVGRDVDLKLYKAIDGAKEFTGVLTGYDKDSLTVEIEGKEETFARSEGALVRLAFEM